MIHNSGRWGRVSMVSSLAVGPKGATLARFHVITKKKKTKQREYILGYSKYLKFISFLSPSYSFDTLFELWFPIKYMKFPFILSWLIEKFSIFDYWGTLVLDLSPCSLTLVFCHYSINIHTIVHAFMCTWCRRQWEDRVIWLFSSCIKFGYLVRLGSKSLRSPSPKLIRVLRNPSSTRIIC